MNEAHGRDRSGDRPHRVAGPHMSETAAVSQILRRTQNVRGATSLRFDNPAVDGGCWLLCMLLALQSGCGNGLRWTSFL